MKIRVRLSTQRQGQEFSLAAGTTVAQAMVAAGLSKDLSRLTIIGGTTHVGYNLKDSAPETEELVVSVDPIDR